MLQSALETVKMALPTNSLASSLCRVSQRISDTFLKRAQTPVMQKAHITGNTRRSKSAVPRWYKRMSTGSNNAPSDAQHAGMSPSARFVTSAKNGALVKSTLKNNDVAPKQYLMSYLNPSSPKIVSDTSTKFFPRARSLPRWSTANTNDREDQAGSRDFIPTRSHSNTLMDRPYSYREDTLSSIEAEYKTDESLQEIEKGIMKGLSPLPENKDLATSFRRRVNINLNELDSVIPDDKKTLSMDINVVVSVKSPENGHKPEIGFQELPASESKNEISKYSQSRDHETLEIIEPKDIGTGENWKITDSEVAENLKFGSENGMFSQKDLTEEIGKVYNFLKSNGGPKPTPRYNNPERSTIVQNFDAIKKLYVNALGCVKACQELKNNETAGSNEEDLQFADIIDELEGCFLPEEHIANTGAYSDFTISPLQRKHLLTGARASTGMRWYSSKSDCEKAKKLPCLQSSELSPKSGKGSADSKSVCERMCMPCCKPARDPPRCFYPYHKAPCQKLKAPRPAFSECKQLFEMKQVVPCECVKPRATRCKKSSESETCAKRR